MRVDRLLGEHGIGQDCAAGRLEFERQMESCRLEASGSFLLRMRFTSSAHQENRIMRGRLPFGATTQ